RDYSTIKRPQLYSYNQRNLLLTVTTGAGGGVYNSVVAYAYDGDGNRLQQTNYSSPQPVTTTYHNDNTGLSQVLLADDGAAQTANLFGLDLILQDDNSQTRFLLTDGLGSVRQEIVNDAIQTATTYEPYGRVLAQTGTGGTVYGYTGEQFDSGAGLLYLRARYYNPGLKIFLSRDPYPGHIAIPASQHGYAYVQNNPVNQTDPTGNCPWCLGAGIGFIADYSIQVAGNMHNGMDFWNAVYYKNIDWTQVAASTVAGGVSGGLAPFIPAGTSLGGAMAYGALDGAISGLASQLTLNALTPCRGLGDDLLSTTAVSTLTGAATAGILHQGGEIAGEAFHSLNNRAARYLEYRALRQQGYNAAEAFNLMKQFDASLNPGYDWAFHFTTIEGGEGIIKSGEIWQSTGFTLRGEGVYAGTTPTPGFFIKRTPLLGWGLVRDSPVRIPVYIPSQDVPVGYYSFLPPKTIVFRGNIRLQP
ncbi:MAG: RHS repeat-associated core domain-containing protein, partial [Chloroflexi bacterium]